LKRISRDKVVYSFSPRHKPVDYVDIGEPIVFETIDALGGQIKSESDTIDSLDWSRVDGVTGPVYIRGAKPGDVLVLKIHDIKIENQGFMVIVPGYGLLGDKEFSPKIKIVNIVGDFALFGKLRIKIRPMIGTIGVAPKDGEIPSGNLGRHGGNMDCKNLTANTVVYLPVFTEGALLGIGDLHAVQSDGELSVSAIEVSGEVLVEVVKIIKGKSLRWPVISTEYRYEILACADTLDEAAKEAAYTAVKALSKRFSIPFEYAYMLGSLVIDLNINQVVDPRKGVRASIPKEFISINDILE